MTAYTNFDVVLDERSNAIRSGIPEHLRAWLRLRSERDLGRLRVFISASRTVLDAKAYLAVQAAEETTRNVIWKAIYEFLLEERELGYHNDLDLKWTTDQIVKRILGAEK